MPISAVIIGMYRIKFLLAAVFGTCAYLLVSFFFGPEGLYARENLEKQKRVLQQNVQIIQVINENLSDEYMALRVDPDVIAAYAKRLGYIGENEKIIRLNGIPDTAPLTIDAGKAVLPEKIPSTPEWICKSCGILVFVFFLLVFFTDAVRTAIKKRRLMRKSGRAQEFMHENSQI